MFLILILEYYYANNHIMSPWFISECEIKRLTGSVLDGNMADVIGKEESVIREWLETITKIQKVPMTTHPNHLYLRYNDKVITIGMLDVETGKVQIILMNGETYFGYSNDAELTNKTNYIIY